MNKQDITINLPMEYWNELSKIIDTGFEHTRMNPLTRKELIAWWCAERSLIAEELPSHILNN